jgi:hypothetical protein
VIFAFHSSQFFVLIVFNAVAMSTIPVVSGNSTHALVHAVNINQYSIRGIDCISLMSVTS